MTLTASDKYKKTFLLILIFMVQIFMFSTITANPDPILIMNENGSLSMYNWDIIKTGSEQNLDVKYTIMNERSTKFCISFNDETAKQTYTDDLSNELKDISNIPILKIDDRDNFTINVNKADLSKINVKEDLCFFVNYTNFEGDFKFKIGWNSVSVNSTGVDDSLAFGFGENICLDSTGKMHVAWKAQGSDLWYSNSTNDGATWTSREILGGTVSQVGIICSPNDNIIIYYLDSGDVDIFNSTNSGTTFTTGVIEEIDAFDRISCQSDSNDLIHCCLVETTAQDLWYTNSTSSTNGYEISTTDTDHCDIEINSTDSVHIIITDSAGDDIDIMSSINNFSSIIEIIGDAGSVDSSDLFAGTSVAIDKNDMIHLASIHTSDLWYCNGTFNSDWNCMELDADVSYNPDIAVTEDNEIFIFYQTASNDNGDVMRANSSDGVNFDIRIQVPGEADSGWASIAQSNFPSWNNITDLLHFVYVSGGVIYYDFINLTVATGQQNYTRKLNEGIVLQNIIQSTTDLRKNIVQQLGTNNFIKSQKTIIITSVQTINFDNIMNRLFLGFVNIDDNINIINNVNRFVSIKKRIIDSFSILTMTKTSLIYDKIITQIMSITDSLNKMLTNVIKINDNIIFNNIINDKAILTRLTLQNVSLNNIINNQAILTRLTLQNVSINDIVTKKSIYSRLTFQIIISSDFIKTLYTDVGDIFNRFIFQNFSLNDLINSKNEIFRIIEQNINFNNIINKTSTYFKNLVSFLDLALDFIKTSVITPTITPTGGLGSATLCPPNENVTNITTNKSLLACQSTQKFFDRWWKHVLILIVLIGFIYALFAYRRSYKKNKK